MRAELLFRRPCLLGESPRWDDLAQVVRWVDIDRGEVCAVDLTGAGFEVRSVGAPCGALVLDRSGSAIVAVGSTWYDLDGGRVVARLDQQGFRFNDAGVDSLGRIWSGTMRSDEDLGPPASAALYRIDSPAPRAVAGGLFAANGIAWSPDETVLYCVDSGANAILRATFDVESMRVGPLERWVAVENGMPDGLAVDRAGGVWSAIWGSGHVARFGPDGVMTHEVSVATPNVTALTFAGDDLRTIVITTAALDTAGDPLAGSLFIADAPVPGRELYRADLRPEVEQR